MIQNPQQTTLRLHDGYSHTSPQLRNLVLNLQKLLRAHGQSVALDGFFGPTTETAVEDFQRSAGITVDGIVGSATWRALVTGEIDPPASVGVMIFHAPLMNSRKEVELVRHSAEAEKYRDVIGRVATETGLAQAFIVAIGSRESGWGLLLAPRGPGGKGDHGHGRGLLQIDDRFHVEFIRSGEWQDPYKNLSYGARLFVSYRQELRERINDEAMTEEALTRAALAAYNAGVGNVMKARRKGLDVDYFTTGRNYSKDVVGRAGFFQSKGWEI